MPTDEQSTAAFVTAYQETAVRWGELQSDSSAANEVFDENHSIYKLLRATPEGREGIAKLMAHPTSVGVRLLAATHSLGWEPKTAVATLQSVEREGGLSAVTAKYTLRAYRAGELDLDW